MTPNNASQIHTVAAALKHAATCILSDTARLDAELLLAYVLEKPRVWLYTWPDKTLTPHQYTAFWTLVNKRKMGEPIAYLLGEQEFWSLPLKVSPATLIPRCDTERLVESVLAYIKNKSLTAPHILDLGCGTGAISLALASELPQATVLGVDKVLEAVNLATQNAKNLSIHHATFKQSDWFSSVGKPVHAANNSNKNVSIQAHNRPFDIIVSNPPYIDKNDIHLTQGDVMFEPLSALIAENNGLADIEYIIQASSNYLTAGGALFFEHGWQQAQHVQALLTQKGFTHCETYQDIAGHDRVTFGIYP